MKPHFLSAHRIQEIVQAVKCLQEGQAVDFKNHGAKGRKLEIRLDLADGNFADIRLVVTAGIASDPKTYEAALLISGPRVRGIGYSPTRQRKFYKNYIEKGWHENILDWALPKSDLNHNRHVPLSDCQPSDLTRFLRYACEKWNIRLDFEKELL
ncbi:MAG: hypothetical protein PHD76_14385 [Methylacidiphilales bacterium]|nr:hypothetical protein [Candidatus Methylacidiphilales bacterium]